jgi:hypothetical protein
MLCQMKKNCFVFQFSIIIESIEREYIERVYRESIEREYRESIERV